MENAKEENPEPEPQNPDEGKINEEGAIMSLLKEHPGGFSIAPDGRLTADREAIAITSLEQFSGIAREPKTVVLDLRAGRTVRVKIRPLDVNEQREIDALDSESPLPPLKPKPSGPSLALGKPTKTEAAGLEDYDWQNKEYRAKLNRHRELKRAATVSMGLVDLEVPGKTLEERAAYLAEHFTVRILDGLEASIRELSSEPIERAVFT